MELKLIKKVISFHAMEAPVRI